MSLHRTEQLLLPVKPWFIVGSLFVALLLNLLPFGRTPWVPDILLLVLAFWVLQQPLFVGVTIAFLCGLVMDVHHTTLLGMHALAYSIVACLMHLSRRHLQWFSPWSQMLQVFGILLLGHGCLWLLRLIAGGDFPGWSLLLAPVIEAVLWPFISLLLLAPQRLAPDRDLTRPL
ncbi:rod shape-determining protein MreD [Brachymonas sp. G13]|uniref:rod shape-determining protein MreD n=1 Tax=Brachymonas TaxID=28219 RepID=UPI0016AD12B9|nr:rod shape-determining protein MreD [Brachymonas sp. J145]MEE1653313.1 rod shape-determining protein MreD [Brachymonas sp. J145]NLX15442.1 rod shape-determining protein MreD [Ramlibacter sp.]